MKWLFLLPISLQAQSLPPIGFEWDAPQTLEYALGYRLDWAPGEYAVVPLEVTSFEVKNFPTGLAIPVSVSTVGSTENSTPTTIYIFNMEVLVEESEDLNTWNSVASVLVRGQRKPNSFIRLRLQAVE